MRKLVYVILLIFVVCLGTACKDVCEKAAAVTEDDCGITVDGGDGEDGEEVECEGDAETFSQCVVDNSAAYCEWLEDLTTTNDFTECAL